jgi:nitrogen fixation protein NifX
MSVVVRRFRLVGSEAERASPDASDARTRVRVAIASQDGKNLNAHFGYARRLLVYDVTLRTRRFVESIEVPVTDSPDCEVEEPNRIRLKVDALAGCHVVFALAIGPPAAARIIGAGIHPIKVPAPEPISTVLGSVQSMLKGVQPAWLTQILLKGDHERDGGGTRR